MNTRQLTITRLTTALADYGCPPGRFSLDLREECASTNTVLLELAEHGAASATVLISERQTAGRGRRGREWFAEAGDSLTFSLLWRFAPGMLPVGLSLAAGIAVVRALAKVSSCDTAESNPQTLRLKWPNDILLDGRKLAGILVELVPGATHAAVIGIGLNLRLPADMPADVRARAACWPEATAPETLLAALLAELGTVCTQFAAQGFAGLQREWKALNAHQDQPICLLSDFAPTREGICRGVDNDGALLLDVDGTIERVISGEVSLRPS